MKLQRKNKSHGQPHGIFVGQIIVFFVLTALFASCTSHRYTDIGVNYYVDYACKNPKRQVYHAAESGKKLRGRFKISTSGIHVSAPDAHVVANFRTGLFNGCDSVFSNGQLCEVITHRKGVLQGTQMAFDDSVRIKSEFIDGTIHGYQETYINDRLSKKTYYNHGVRDSTEFYYDSSGNVLTTLQYHHFQYEDWMDQPDIRDYALVSFTSFDSLPRDVLRRAEYRGTVMFFSYDPLGVVDVSPFDVVHSSITGNGYCDESNPFGYYYIIDENTCKVCDYIDREDIWIAYTGPYGSYGVEGFEQIEFFSLTRHRK